MRYQPTIVDCYGCGEPVEIAAPVGAVVWCETCRALLAGPPPVRDPRVWANRT